MANLHCQLSCLKPNYLVILSPTQHHSVFRNLPPLHENYDVKRETVQCYPRIVDRCCTWSEVALCCRWNLSAFSKFAFVLFYYTISMFLSTLSWETLRFSGNKIHCSPRDHAFSVYCTMVQWGLKPRKMKRLKKVILWDKKLICFSCRGVIKAKINILGKPVKKQWNLELTTLYITKSSV